MNAHRMTLMKIPILRVKSTSQTQKNEFLNRILCEDFNLDNVMQSNPERCKKIPRLHTPSIVTS